MQPPKKILKKKGLWQKWNNPGINIPLAHDPDGPKPSASLLFAYITFLIATVSTIALHFLDKLFTATCVAIAFWVMAVVFYKFRKLDRFKFDLDDKSLELGDSDDKEEEEKQETVADSDADLP